jgi:hypothetical protein
MFEVGVEVGPQGIPQAGDDHAELQTGSLRRLALYQLSTRKHSLKHVFLIAAMHPAPPLVISSPLLLNHPYLCFSSRWASGFD